MSWVEMQNTRIYIDIEKQMRERFTPMKPLRESGEVFHLGNLTANDTDYIDICCPNCGNEGLYYGQHFCDNCGRALDWSED